jgi:hypothetical protein
MLVYLLSQKVMDRKLSFWLPFRATATSQNQAKTNAYIKELKINFGDKLFNRE